MLTWSPYHDKELLNLQPAPSWDLLPQMILIFLMVEATLNQVFLLLVAVVTQSLSSLSSDGPCPGSCSWAYFMNREVAVCHPGQAGPVHCLWAKPALFYSTCGCLGHHPWKYDLTWPQQSCPQPVWGGGLGPTCDFSVLKCYRTEHVLRQQLGLLNLSLIHI